MKVRTIAECWAMTRESAESSFSSHDPAAYLGMTQGTFLEHCRRAFYCGFASALAVSKDDIAPIDDEAQCCAEFEKLMAEIESDPKLFTVIPLNDRVSTADPNPID